MARVQIGFKNAREVQVTDKIGMKKTPPFFLQNSVRGPIFPFEQRHIWPGCFSIGCDVAPLESRSLHWAALRWRPPS